MYKPYSKRSLSYITLISALLSLTGCEYFLGIHGKPAENTRTASFEQRRDEEVFSTFYEIYFDSNSKTLNAEAKASVIAIADLIKTSAPRTVIVSGYSDSFGNAAYNHTLSKNRARAVANALQEQGIKEGLMTIEALGEAEPLIPTQDEIKILENRRVRIALKK